jgi:signal transduction histidine kinase/tetratricopeptide (TPR) repeat protein
LGFSYNQLASLEERFGEVENAKAHFDKAIALMEQVENPTRLHLVYNNFGVFHQRQGNYPEALGNYTKALKLAEKYKNKHAISSYLTNIGNIYFYQNNFEKALEYYFKSSALQEETQNFRSLAITYNNIAGVYLAQKKYLKAIPLLKKAKLYHEQLQNKRGELSTSINLGISYMNLNDYDSSDFYYQKAIEYQKETEDKYNLVLILTNLAKSNYQQEKYEQALEYTQKAYPIAKEIQSLSNVTEILDIKKEILLAQKNYKDAYDVQVLYHEAKDSLYSLQSKAEINAVLLERKELENERLEQDNAFKIIALGKETLQRQSKEQQFNLLEKQAEADRLFSLAKDAKNKQEADSLYRAAQNAQLEADNLKIKAEKTEAEKRATKAESDQKIAFQRNLSILFGVIVLAALTIAFIAYRNQRNKQKANLLLAEKNEEINIQNELLEDSNQTKDRLFSIIAHDLRSPMMAFQDVSRQLEFYIQKQDSEKLLKTVKLLDTSANNLTSLLNNLLHWSLLQQNQKTRYQFDSYSLSLLLSEIITTYQTISEPKQIEWQLAIPTQFSVWVDAPSFQTIIRNIVSNAIKFSPQTGKITIQATQKENLITLSIQDTGAGIPLEVQKNLSQNTLNPTQKGTKNEKGTGLGLLLCYQFAKENNIVIGLESQEQKGTTFTFLIPTQKK